MERARWIGERGKFSANGRSLRNLRCSKNRFLRERGVTLTSAGLDEVPMAYKNIREVMAAQSDLVTVLGQFDPKLVKMAPSGERPED